MPTIGRTRPEFCGKAQDCRQVLCKAPRSNRLPDFSPTGHATPCEGDTGRLYRKPISWQAKRSEALEGCSCIITTGEPATIRLNRAEASMPSTHEVLRADEISRTSRSEEIETWPAQSAPGYLRSHTFRYSEWTARNFEASLVLIPTGNLATDRSKPKWLQNSAMRRTLAPESGMRFG